MRVPDPGLAIGFVGGQIVVDGLLPQPFVLRLQVVRVVSGLKVDQLGQSAADVNAKPGHC